jgi:hypothetical protein
MSNAPRETGVVPRRIHLVVAIDRLLVRRLTLTPYGHDGGATVRKGT